MSTFQGERKQHALQTVSDRHLVTSRSIEEKPDFLDPDKGGEFMVGAAVSRRSGHMNRACVLSGGAADQTCHSQVASSSSTQ